jgi:hypothetical protein
VEPGIAIGPALLVRFVGLVGLVLPTARDLTPATAPAYL